jgi:Zn finger protein HypA/HybF involved in hydrogenase expression
MQTQCPDCLSLGKNLQTESAGNHLRRHGGARGDRKEMDGTEPLEERLWQYFDCPHCGTSWFRVTLHDKFEEWEGEPDQGGAGNKLTP